MEMMMSLSTTEALLGSVLVLSTIYFIRTYLESRRYPSGPTSLPLVGNLHQIMLAGGPIEFYDKYYKKYGNIYTITLGPLRRVVISGYDNVLLMVSKHASITSRRNKEILPTTLYNQIKERPGLLYGEDWKEKRAQCSKYLREEGMGKSTLEPLITGEVEHFCQFFIEKNAGQGLDLQYALTQATCNIIYTMMMGLRLNYSNPKLTELIEISHDLFTTTIMAAMTRNVPFAAWFSGDPFLHRKNTKCYLKLQERMDEINAAREVVLEAGEAPSQLADHLLVNISNEDGERKRLGKDAGTTMEQILVAGTDTSASLLNWTFLYMAVHQDVQEKVHTELNAALDVVAAVVLITKPNIAGSGEPLSYAMRSKLPYTEAVILESLRHSVMIPVLHSHVLDESLSFEEKVIPANTELLFNLQSVYKDPSVFEKPEVYNPERFLVGDIKLKRSYVGMAFGNGRRACLGEPLARMETFLFFASIMHRYRVEYKDSEPPSLKGVCGMLNIPRPYQALFTTL